jgi:hypothetical protein
MPWPSFSWSALVFGSIGERDDRLREDHLLEDDRLLLVAERVAGGRRLEADRGGDVAGVDFLDLFALVGVHLQQAADALGLALGGVDHRGARGQRARVDAEERELADERVGHDLERQRRERFLVVGRALDHRLFLRIRVDAGDRRNVERRRQVVDDGVEHRLDTLVLERGAAHDRDERRVFLADRRDAALAKRGLQFVFGNRFAAEIFFEELVVRLADLFDQLLVIDLGLVEHVGRNVLHVVVGAHGLVLVDERLHAHEIDDALELVFGADRQLNRDGIAFELAGNLRERLLEVRADAVHLVDEADARHAVLVGLAPHGFRLRLDTRDGVEHGDRAVEHAQRTLHFNREIDVAGRIDDVDAMVAPEARRRGGRDRDAALLLLLHPVHHRRAFVDFADLVRNTRIEEDPLGGGRLPGIDVGHDADVPGFFEWCRSRHYELLSALN